MTLEAGELDRLRYVGQLSLSNRLLRLLWGFARPLFRGTPERGFYKWRAALLRAFGARVGRHSRISASCRIWAPWNLTAGDLVCIGPSVDVYNVARVKLADKVTVSQRAFLCTASHDITKLERPLISRPITIGKHAWVAAEAYVGPGVAIGDGAVVAARAVVVRDVEPWVMVGGNPARVLGQRKIADRP